MTFWVAGAAIGGAVISGVATSNAADKQAQSSANAIGEQGRQFDITQANTAPYRAAGASALGQESYLLGVPGSENSQGFDSAAYLAANPDVAQYIAAHPAGTTGATTAEQHYQQFGQQEGRSLGTPTAGGTGGDAFGSYAKPLTADQVQLDPGYQFGQQQGQLGIDRKTAAAGGRISGASLKAASQFNTDYATTGYSTAYNRQNQARSDRLNRLSALAGIGQTSTQQVATAGTSAANAIGNIATAQGNASGAAQLAQGNIWSGAGNQISALYGRNNGTTTGGGVSPPNPFFYGGGGVINDGGSNGYVG